MKIRRIKSESGASLVEFAIVLPLLLLFLFGIIEFGFLLFNKAMLTNAAREGARAGIVFKMPERVPKTDIEDIVRNYCANHLITFVEPRPEVGVTVNVAGETYNGNLGSGDYLEVIAEYDYTFLVLPNIFKLINAVGIADLPATVNLSAVSQMRAE
jgi:Flp pilus assembly protein TadG